MANRILEGEEEYCEKISFVMCNGFIDFLSFWM